MTKEEVIAELKEVNKLDTECAHYKADEILCKLLKSLSYQDVVEVYNDIYKWYA